MNIQLYLTQHFFRNPMRLVVSTFALLVMLGTFLLLMPWATVGGKISFIDALFTATSACSVTGLAVVDSGSYFTFWGQLIILLLVQVGGIGIMTFSTLFLLMSGHRPGIIEAQTLKDTYTQSGEYNPLQILKDVFMFTIFIEVIGIFLIFIVFVNRLPVSQAFFYSVFHAVASFCNAGFSLFPDNLMSYRFDWLLNLTVAGLVILGGLGFLIFSDIKRAILSPNRFWKEISLHTKLVIVSTFFLLTASTAILFWMERNHTGAGLSWDQNFLTAFFHAVSARTAGFNTVDMGLMANESLFFIMVLMFIGAGPGSTAGGVKVTTMTVLLLLGLGNLNGEERPQAFYRTINKRSVDKAMTLVLLSFIIIVIMVILLQISEEGNQFLSLGHAKFLDLCFETVSAFGTVGLSTGITGKLTSMGKFLIVIMMAVGKLGMLTLVFAISQRRVKKFYYSEENVMIG